MPYLILAALIACLSIPPAHAAGADDIPLPDLAAPPEFAPPPLPDEAVTKEEGNSEGPGLYERAKQWLLGEKKNDTSEADNAAPPPPPEAIKKEETEQIVQDAIKEAETAEPEPTEAPPAPPKKEHDFKTQILSPLIYKKAYDRENQHLPQARYHSEYVRMTFTALERGEREIVRGLLHTIGSVNLRDGNATPLLVRAVMLKNLGITQMLLGEKADTAQADKAGKTALHYAAEQGRPDFVKLLLSFGADPNLEDAEGNTPLMLAAVSPSASCVSLLVTQGSELERADHLGRTALWKAIAARNVPAVEILLSKNADVNRTADRGTTALMAAVTTQDPAIVQALLHADAEVNARDAYGRTAYDISEQLGGGEISQMLHTSMTERMMVTERMKDEKNKQERIAAITEKLYRAQRDPKTHIPLPVLRPSELAVLPPLPTPSFGAMTAAAEPARTYPPLTEVIAPRIAKPEASAILPEPSFPTPPPETPPPARPAQLMRIFR